MGNQFKGNISKKQIKEKKKERIKSVLTGFFLILLSFGIVTQYIAHKFKYAEALGFNFNGIYPPWNFIFWYIKWNKTYPNIFHRGLSILVFCLAVGFLILLIYQIISKNSNKKMDYLHGSARWAKQDEIEDAGLLGAEDIGESVYVGGWVDKKGNLRYLKHSGAEHILTYAPTRSGKGVGLVLPTLLSWQKSCVITDLKGELWALTAGWRQKHADNKVIKFEPAAIGSARWNPLQEIRVGTEFETGDVQNLATLIVDPDGKGLVDHWQKTAQSLLTGVILFAIYKYRRDKKIASMAAVDSILSNPDQDIAELWAEMMVFKDEKNQPIPSIASAGKDMADRPEEEAGSVLSTAKSYLALYRDPVVAKNTSVSDFNILDLMNYKNPVSLYIVTQPNDKARLRPLVRVLLNMIIRILTTKLEFEDGRPKKSYKHRLLAMLDEFPSLGKLEILQESLAFVAGYGIKCYLICQDLNQLKSRETGYGADETITSNCHIQNAYPPNRVETGEHLSRLTGTTTITKEQITVSGKRVAAMLGGVSKTLQETQRPLLTADEALRLPGPKKDVNGMIVEAGDMIIYAAGFPAIYGRQILYFQDDIFLERAKVVAPDKSDILF